MNSRLQGIPAAVTRRHGFSRRGTPGFAGIGVVPGVPVLIYRTHLRRLRAGTIRSATDSADSPCRKSPPSRSRSDGWPFERQYSTDSRGAWGFDEVAVPWSESLSRAGEDFCLSPGRWTAGPWWWAVDSDPAQDVDALYRWLNRPEPGVGEVHFIRPTGCCSSIPGCAWMMAV